MYGIPAVVFVFCGSKFISEYTVAEERHPDAIAGCLSATGIQFLCGCQSSGQIFAKSAPFICSGRLRRHHHHKVRDECIRTLEPMYAPARHVSLCLSDETSAPLVLNAGELVVIQVEHTFDSSSLPAVTVPYRSMKMLRAARHENDLCRTREGLVVLGREHEIAMNACTVRRSGPAADIAIQIRRVPRIARPIRRIANILPSSGPAVTALHIRRIAAFAASGPLAPPIRRIAAFAANILSSGPAVTELHIRRVAAACASGPRIRDRAALHDEPGRDDSHRGDRQKPCAGVRSHRPT